MTEPIADILDRCADLIEPPGAWTQGTFARDASGKGVVSGSPDATCWCASGAIDRVAPYSLWLTVRNALRKVSSRHISDWNDAPERTQSEVVAAFRKAARMERGHV